MEKTKYTSKAGSVGRKKISDRAKMALRDREDQTLPVSSHTTLIPSEDSKEDSAQTPLPKMASHSHSCGAGRGE